MKHILFTPFLLCYDWMISIHEDGGYDEVRWIDVEDDCISIDTPFLRDGLLGRARTITLKRWSMPSRLWIMYDFAASSTQVWSWSHGLGLLGGGLH